MSRLSHLFFGVPPAEKQHGPTVSSYAGGKAVPREWLRGSATTRPADADAARKRRRKAQRAARKHNR